MLAEKGSYVVYVGEALEELMLPQTFWLNEFQVPSEPMLPRSEEHTSELQSC